MKFKVGDNVKYTSGRFSTCLDNPLWGTELESRGTIAKIMTYDLGIHVNWENGAHNTYNESDLELCTPKTRREYNLQCLKQSKK